MIWKQLYVSFSTFWLKYFAERSEEMMAKIYFNRLYCGTITFDAIDPRYQEDVRRIGIQWVRIGRLTVEHYEMMFKEPYPGEGEG